MDAARPPRNLADRLQAAFDWAATASAQPRSGGPAQESLQRAAAALRQAAGHPDDPERVARLLAPVVHEVVDEWPWDDALGAEVLACSRLAQELAPG